MNTYTTKTITILLMTLTLVLYLASTQVSAQDAVPPLADSSSANEETAVALPSSPMIPDEKYPRSGNASTLAVIVAPVLILLVGVGAALWFHKFIK